MADTNVNTESMNQVYQPLNTAGYLKLRYLASNQPQKLNPTYTKDEPHSG